MMMSISNGIIISESSRENSRSRPGNFSREKAKAARQSLRAAVKAAEVQIASKEKQREENARFLERALASLETSRKEYEQGEVRLARTDEESKSLRLELQQARKLDVQLESALKARSEADERMKDFSRRKQEAEEKLRKVEERQKKASEEWDKQTSWRERYRSKEGIAEQLSALLIHLNTCLTARRAVERSDKALLAIRQKIQRLEVRRQSLRREAEAHAKEQVKIEEERKSVALALKELEPEALDWSIETCRTERERLLLEQALSILSPLTRRMSVCWPWRIASRKLPCASSGFSTGKNGRRPAGNNSPPCNRKNWSCINNSPRTRTHGRN